MSYALLKEEINQTHNTIYDIAKWKLILVSSISAVALGLSKEQTGDFHLLFLLLPLVCAYSDLLYYQNLLRIFVLATFLRKRQSWDSVVEYEQFVCKTRKHRVFNLELSSQLLSSLVFSFAAIVAIYLEIQHPTFSPNDSVWPQRVISGVWATGVVLILWVYVLFRQRNWILDREENKKADIGWWWNVSFWIAALAVIAVAAYQLPTTMSKWPKPAPTKIAPTPSSVKK
jgi:hypothetical protein